MATLIKVTPVTVRDGRVAETHHPVFVNLDLAAAIVTTDNEEPTTKIIAADGSTIAETRCSPDDIASAALFWLRQSFMA